MQCNVTRKVAFERCHIHENLSHRAPRNRLAGQNDDPRRHPRRKILGEHALHDLIERRGPSIVFINVELVCGDAADELRTIERSRKDDFVDHDGCCAGLVRRDHDGLNHVQRVIPRWA